MKSTFTTILFLFSGLIYTQDSLDELLKKFNNESIPYISVTELKEIQDSVILLDAREKEEFEVSHIPKAKLIGYNQFMIQNVIQQNIQKNDTIVVYCSLGVRSEDISEKLKQAGYLYVYNLYGGIFEWKNKDFVVVNSKEQPTEEIHACSAQWAKWLLKGKKVYTN
ncbi:rhodanese-like domain-containing protein [Aquimarina gracilis]|uniref:Rhodanese-like domain-containing protein n=1 Tax=Aquimarina gracilis TaxID=874422 RepID=A0ABU5ZUB6_9FLAO|nr:rhodanese-like domain-containing protein [Aquimarina gracilis]MEB3345258.1 rhodanese-like domain-containing protein [Aquimarina gracilis]